MRRKLVAGRYGDSFGETKALIYELFSTRHNRRVVWYENLLDIALGLYLVVMMAIIEAVAVPTRWFWSWVQRCWGATFGRIHLPYVERKILWWVFGGIGGLVLAFTTWVILYSLGVVG